MPALIYVDLLKVKVSHPFSPSSGPCQTFADHLFLSFAQTFFDGEAMVIGHKAGKGKYIGMTGSLEVRPSPPFLPSLCSRADVSLLLFYHSARWPGQSIHSIIPTHEPHVLIR